MNRRQFTTSLTAVAAAPALPVRALASAPAVATTVPNGARFWAIYMSHLHGNCSAKTLSTMTGMDIPAAQNCLTSLISDGVIKPTRLLGKVAESHANTAQKPSRWKERVKKFIDEKQEEIAPPESEVDVEATNDETEDHDGNDQ